MTVAIDFTLAPADAIDFFRGKGLQPTYAWQDMMREEHDAAFTVAKMVDVDLLEDVRGAVDKALSEGRTLRQFRDELEPELMRRGWWGRAEMIDPRTGERETVQLGSPRRLRTIFQTNVKTAYAAGQWQRIQDVAERRPYLMYDAVLDERTRPEHAEWDGTVLPADDPWWESHYPPNGWGCRCSVVQLDAAQLRRMGKSGPDERPPGTTRRETNPRTGEVRDVPTGIDEGWDYHPGRDRVAGLVGQLTARAARGSTATLAAPAAAQVERRLARSSYLETALSILRRRPISDDAGAQLRELRAHAPEHEHALFDDLLDALDRMA